MGLQPPGYQSVDDVEAVIAFAERYGVSEVYFYGSDESSGQALLDQRDSWQAIINAGGKIFVSGTKVGYYSTYPANQGNFGLVGDLQDLMICYGAPDAEEAARWHSLGHEIFCYSNPQVGLEQPSTYRNNFGLLLWQSDYDGAMDFAYQEAYGSIWNDFDNAGYRDHVFAYPTIDGVIDTIQWEGWREGVDDIRYLTTLIGAIESSKSSGKDTSSAETWLANLKSSNLATKNLDTVRSEMVTLILSLQDTQNSTPILATIGNKSVNEGSQLQFTISASDADNDSLVYSATNLPSGATFDAATKTFTWTPNYVQSGTYSDITFKVTDGSITVQEVITISVNQPYVDWDVNEDGKINDADLKLVQQKLGATGTLGWTKEDVNHDSVVSILDMIIIGQKWTG
jgi:hypothetical protein